MVIWGTAAQQCGRARVNNEARTAGAGVHTRADTRAERCVWVRRHNNNHWRPVQNKRGTHASFTLASCVRPTPTRTPLAKPPAPPPFLPGPQRKEPSHRSHRRPPFPRPAPGPTPFRIPSSIPQTRSHKQYEYWSVECVALETTTCAQRHVHNFNHARANTTPCIAKSRSRPPRSR